MFGCDHVGRLLDPPQRLRVACTGLQCFLMFFGTDKCNLRYACHRYHVVCHIDIFNMTLLYTLYR